MYVSVLSEINNLIAIHFILILKHDFVHICGYISFKLSQYYFVLFRGPSLVYSKAVGSSASAAAARCR